MKRVVTVPGDTGDTSPYVDALRQAGIEAVFGTSFGGVSGLMLMGGTDVNPARYGEPRLPETEDPDDDRDAAEAALIAEALERDLPILAICRGMQMLNVQHGGTLLQHLAQHPPKKDHSIEIVPGTRLARIAGSERHREVNSRHHQSVARLGAGLVVSARAGNIIEAIERPDKRFVVGVQWHPENQVAVRDGIAKGLFDAFAAAL